MFFIKLREYNHEFEPLSKKKKKTKNLRNNRKRRDYSKFRQLYNCDKMRQLNAPLLKS